MKRTLAFILTMLMVITMVPASLLTAMARGKGVSANGIDNLTVSNAPDQYIPETIVVDGRVRDTGWPYDDWNKVNTETGTWSVQNPDAENLGLVYTYQLKTDYYFLYGGFIIETPDVAGPLTIWLNNGDADADNTYTHKFVIDLETDTAKRYDAAGKEIENKSPYDYEKFQCDINRPGAGRTVIEFKSLLADFCPTKAPKLSYFVSLEAGNGQALYHPAIKMDEGFNRNDLLPSLSNWPSEHSAKIDIADINGYGDDSFIGAFTVDGEFDEAVFAEHTNFYSVWFERMNLPTFKTGKKDYSDLVYNKLEYANTIGGEHDLRVSSSKIFGAALLQDDTCPSSYYDTLVIFNLYQGSDQLQVVLRWDNEDANYNYAYATLNGTSVGTPTWGAMSTGAPNTYSFEFSLERSGTISSFVPDYYDFIACAYPDSTDTPVDAYTSTATGCEVTYYRNSIHEYYDPYSVSNGGFYADGYLGARVWPGLTVAASTVNGDVIDSTYAGTRVQGLNFLHTMAVDYEHAHGAVHIVSENNNLSEWQHGTATSPNQADYFTIYLKNSDSTSGTVFRFDMWTYLEGDEVRAAIGVYSADGHYNICTDAGEGKFKVAFVNRVDGTYAFEYAIPLASIEGITLDYGQSIVDGTTASPSPDILEYYAMLSVVQAESRDGSDTYLPHTNLVWPKTGVTDATGMPTGEDHTWESNPAVVKYQEVVRAIEVDGIFNEELRLQFEKVDYTNSTYRREGTKGNILGGYKKFYVGQQYAYLATRIDGDFINNSTKVTFWVKNSADEIYSYEFYNDGTYFQMSKNGIVGYRSLFYYQFSSANDATNFEAAIPIADFGGENGFEYFVEVQQVVDGEVLQRVSPKVPLPTIANYADNLDLSGSEWEFAGAPKALEYFQPENITVDGNLDDSGWDDEEWIFVSPDINASKQETNEITQLFKSEFYYQMRVDEEFVYLAAVIKYYDAYYYDADGNYVSVPVNNANILNQEPSFRLWIKNGMNGSDTTVGAANTYTSYYDVSLDQSGNVVLTNQLNLFPTYANNTRPLYDKDYNRVVPQQNEDGSYIKGDDGQILFETVSDPADRRVYPTAQKYDNLTGANDSHLFGYDKIIINEEEAVIVNENGQTFGETLNPEQYAERNMIKDTLHIEAGTIQFADGKKFYRDGGEHTLGYDNVVVEMKVRIDEFNADQFFQYYVSTGTNAKSWYGSKATVYPTVPSEPDSASNYYHYKYPYWYWEDRAAVNVTDSLRQDMTLRTYKKPVITLGAKVNETYNYYNPDTKELKEVNAIRFGGLWTEEYIRHVNGLFETGGYSENGNYTDYWDVKQMGMVILPTRLTEYNKRVDKDEAHPGDYELFVDTPGAAWMDADGIVNWAGPTLGTNNDFADYTDFAFYVTVVNAPPAMNFCFRGFVTYYNDVNGGLPYYDVVLERGINMVVDKSSQSEDPTTEEGALKDAPFLDEHYKPGTGASGNDKFDPNGSGSQGGNQGGEDDDDEEVIIPAAPANENTIAYIPLDNRPVNVDRVQYLAAAAGYDLRMPSAADYVTVMDGNITYGDAASSHGGNPANLLYWLKTQEAAGVDNYVISLDQVFSGGLANSRVTTGYTVSNKKDYEYLEYEIADYLIELSKENNVAYGDTVMRLAPETEYQGYTDAQYNILRAYGAQERYVLTGEALNVDNIVDYYTIGIDGNVLSTTVSDWSIEGGSGTVNEADLNRHLAARERKLRLIDYVINNAGADIEHLFIAVDDSASGDSIQVNERNYIKQIASAKGLNYQLFAGADELGMLGVAALASDKYYPSSNLPVNVVYFGTHDEATADNYDYAPLSDSINTHLAALGASHTGERNKNTLQVLVLTRSGDDATARENQAQLLVEQLKANLTENIPTVVLDCSNAWADNDRTLSDAMFNSTGWGANGFNLAETLGISGWNTIGNTVGIGLSNAIGRFAHIMNSDTVTDASNRAFVKGMTFALIKDISYRAHTKGNTDNFGGYTVGHNNFGFEQNDWGDVNHILEKLNANNYILGKDGEEVGYGTISISGVSWPWRRDFECRFDINVGDYVPPVEDDDDFESQTITIGYHNPTDNPSADNNIIYTATDYKTGTEFMTNPWWYRALLEYDDNEGNYKVIEVDPMGEVWQNWTVGIDRVVIAAHDTYDAEAANIIAGLQVGQRLELVGMTHAQLATDTAEATNISFKTISTEDETKIVLPDVSNPTLAPAVPNNTVVAYIPLDDRPVHTDRIEYLAKASGITLKLPNEEDYKTVVNTDLEDGGASAQHGGNTANILAWLKEQEAAGVDYYVISLDQIFSGGLVNSRYSDPSYTGILADEDLATVRYLTQLAKDNYVVYADTVMRLAATSGYKDHDSTLYYALRNYGIPERQNLVEAGIPLTLSNVVSSYRYSTYGVTAISRTNTDSGVTATVAESDLKGYLAARERKLRIIDYLIKNAGANIDTLMIGIDDSSAGWNIQANEVEYIKKIITDYQVNGTVFAGADEMGVSGIANVAAHLFPTTSASKGNIPVNVKYYGPAADAQADKYDNGTLRESVDLHLQAIGAKQVANQYINDPTVLQILVLTRAQVSVESTGDASEYAAALAQQVIYNLENNIPTCIIDASNHYGGSANYVMTALNNAGIFGTGKATNLLGYSQWNTVGNAVGVGLGNAIGRYAYITYADEVTEASNMGQLQALTFSFIKDSTYKAVANVTEAWNFDTPAAGYFTANGLLTLLNEQGTLLFKRGNNYASEAHGLVIDLGTKTLPWGRVFEARIPVLITVDENAGGDEPVVPDPEPEEPVNKVINSIELTTEGSATAGSALFDVTVSSVNGDESLKSAIDSVTRQWYLDVNTPLYSGSVFEQGTEYDLFVKATRASDYTFAGVVTYTLTTADGSTYTGVLDSSFSTDDMKAFDFYITGK